MGRNMSSKPEVSIIICTRNRADDLRQTLTSLAEVCVPDGIAAELLIVDNASTDNTAQVVRECVLPNMPVRSVFEPRSGLCRARNIGMAAAAGRVLLFTDDDLRFPPDWIAGMAGPILRTEADAVAGGVRFAPHLERSWMTAQHRAWLAGTDDILPHSPSRMVGANMAFGRHVLEKVPAFDTELGAGALGPGDESLFSFQLLGARYRLVSAFETPVEHHFDPARLSPDTFRIVARRTGRGLAYLHYHWWHRDVTVPRLRLWKSRLLLSACPRDWPYAEGLSPREMHQLLWVGYFEQMLRERSRPRQYDQFGWIKRQNAVTE